VRNTNLALMLKAALFPAVPGAPDPFGDGVLYIALMYGGLALPLIAPLVLLHRRHPPSK
jgi:BASS family bile acid:Na+ symporter